METEMTTVNKSLACLRFFGQAPEYGKAPHPHTQGQVARPTRTRRRGQVCAALPALPRSGRGLEHRQP